MIGRKNLLAALGILFLLLMIYCPVWYLPAVEKRIEKERLAESLKKGRPASLEVTFHDKKIVLSGVVPDAAVKDRILDEAKKRFSAGAYSDSINVDAAARPAYWLNVAADLLPPGGKEMKGGGVKVTGKDIILSGEVDSVQTRMAIYDSIVKSKSNLAVIDRMTVAPAGGATTATTGTSTGVKPVGGATSKTNIVTSKGAQTSPQNASGAKAAAAQQNSKKKPDPENLDKQIRGKTIEYDPKNEQLSPAGIRILGRIADILKAEPDLPVEIAVYTDTQNDAARSLEISRKRADAIKHNLIERGVTAARLTAKGYGSVNPIADNATPTGRSQNCRIAFKVIR